MTEIRSILANAKPFLKWAGGKGQLLSQYDTLLPPDLAGKEFTYIEPFVGGGAMLFHMLQMFPKIRKVVINDINPFLVTAYRVVKDNPNELVERLKDIEFRYYELENEEAQKTFFLDIREIFNEKLLDDIDRTSYLVFLNRTCFNGLYRLNRKGQFNTPFGRYKNPTICNEEKIRAASEVLQNAEIVCGDYLDVLKKYAKKNDFVFLDPPYVPISEYADFKRYTKEQFYEEDQVNLANEVHRLVKIGCKVMLTNSNHPLVHELYGKYKIEVIQTKRNINRNGDKRNGEDVIVTTY